MTRFIFRQADVRDLELFFEDGEIRANLCDFPQQCHRTSFSQIVERREKHLTDLPHGGVVNNYVPFYFCPINAYSHVISKGNVDVHTFDGKFVERSNIDNRIFLVSEVNSIVNSDLNWCYSNLAINSSETAPEVITDIDLLEEHINWSVFDEYPLIADIPEIGYQGCCKFFSNNEHYKNRKAERMAEFLVYESVPIDFISTIITPTKTSKQRVSDLVRDYGYDINVFLKRNCFECQ